MSVSKKAISSKVHESTDDGLRNLHANTSWATESSSMVIFLTPVITEDLRNLRETLCECLSFCILECMYALLLSLGGKSSIERNQINSSVSALDDIFFLSHIFSKQG